MLVKKSDYRQIARETIKATQTGSYYDANGKKCKLPILDYTKVEVFSPNDLEAIEDDEDEFFERAFCGSGGAEFFLVDEDSLEAANGFDNVLVMNFANAHRPGGGFLDGARAQEESLCRCSTLYASISSDKSKEMYDYNNRMNDPLDSNYMLLSKNVAVFRDFNCNPLPEEAVYIVSVVTVPAPNKNGRACNVKQSEIDECMQDRIEKMLWMAARKGYSNLVLGAWGCGAFGHDARTVAQYFYNAFFEGVEFHEFFDTVCFAIPHDEDKLQAFQEVFGDKLATLDIGDDFSELGDLNGVIACRDFPVCNHKQFLDKNNLGYCQGILTDGMPFEAELYECELGQGIAIIMPLINENNEKRYDSVNAPTVQRKVIEFPMESGFIDASILDIGMVDHGEAGESEVHKYVNYFVDNDLVRFTTDIYNGAGWYRTDILGNDLIKIVITLSENGQIFADTNLNFRGFVENQGKKQGKVIRFPES